MDEPATAIERLEPREAARQLAGAGALLGTTDPAGVLARIDSISAVVRAAIDQRQLARRYGDSDRDFILIEGWQLVAGMVGVTAIVTSTAPLEGGAGWEAVAECRRLVDDAVLGRHEAMCSRTESGRAKQSENAIRAMAEVRARRGALRSVLSWIPTVGGVSIADPDAPVTAKQVTAIWAAAGAAGLDRDQVHELAGVASVLDLSREQAAGVLDQLDRLAPEDGPGEAAGPAAEEVCEGFIGEDDLAPCTRCGWVYEAHRRPSVGGAVQA